MAADLLVFGGAILCSGNVPFAGGFCCCDPLAWLACAWWHGVWCGACRAARFALASLREKNGLQVYEVDAVMNPALTNEFGFFHLPSLYLYIVGDYHAQVQSEANPNSMEHAIETLSALPAEEEP